MRLWVLVFAGLILSAGLVSSKNFVGYANSNKYVVFNISDARLIYSTNNGGQILSDGWVILNNNRGMGATFCYLFPVDGVVVKFLFEVTYTPTYTNFIPADGISLSFYNYSNISYGFWLNSLTPEYGGMIGEVMNITGVLVNSTFAFEIDDYASLYSPAENVTGVLKAYPSEYQFYQSHLAITVDGPAYHVRWFSSNYINSTHSVEFVFFQDKLFVKYDGVVIMSYLFPSPVVNQTVCLTGDAGGEFATHMIADFLFYKYYSAIVM